MANNIFKKKDRNDIPNEWKIVKLKDVATDFISGGTPSTSNDEFWGGNIPWMRSAHITKREIDFGEKYITERGLINSATNIVNKSNILVATRVGIGKVAINKVDIAISQDLTGVILNKRKIDENYLYWFLSNSTNKFLSLTQGTTIKGILRKDLELFKIFLPPIIEQRGIAEVLSTVDEAIQRTDAVIAKAQELKRGLMQRLLTRGIGHTKFKQTELGEIPETWKIERLAKCLKLCDYGLSYQLLDKGKYPIFRMNNIIDGYVLENDLKYINLSDNEFSKYKVEKGDILFNRTNSYDLVGKVGIYLLQGNHTFASYLIRLRVDKNKIEPLFLNYFLNLSRTQNKLRRLATRGVSQSNINASNLKTLLTPLPILNEQHKIVNILSNTDQEIRMEKKKKEKLEELNKGLMQVLLTGKIRVRWDGSGLHRIWDG